MIREFIWRVYYGNFDILDKTAAVYRWMVFLHSHISLYLEPQVSAEWVSDAYVVAFLSEFAREMFKTMGLTDEGALAFRSTYVASKVLNVPFERLQSRLKKLQDAPKREMQVEMAVTDAKYAVKKFLLFKNRSAFESLVSHFYTNF